MKDNECNETCFGFVKCKEVRFDDTEFTLGSIFSYENRVYIKGKFKDIQGGFTYNTYEFIEFKPDTLCVPHGRWFQCKHLEISFPTKELMEDMIMTGTEFFNKVFNKPKESN